MSSDQHRPENLEDEMVDAYQQMLEQKQLSFNDAENLVRQLMRLGRQEEAMNVAVRLLDLQQNDADSLMLAGEVCLESRMLADARSYFLRAYRLDTSSTEAIGGLAWVSLYEGKHDEFVEWVTALQRRAPDSFTTIQLHVAGAMAWQPKEETLRYLHELHGHLTSARAVQLWLAEQFAKLDNAQVAADILAQLPKVRQTSADEQLLALEVASKLGSEGVVGACEQFVQSDPTNWKGVLLLGRLIFRQGQVEKALSLFQRANELHPNEATVIGAMATALWRLGRYEDAADAALAAIQLDRHRKDLYLVACDSLVKAGQVVEAEAMAAQFAATFGEDALHMESFQGQP